MSELTPEAVALLEAARQNHGPSEADRRRVLATLHLSLGIGVPVALAPAAAEALSSGHGAVQAASSALQGASASASVQGAGAAAAHAAHGAGAAAASNVAVHGGAQGALSLAGKLLTWKAAKLVLASVALGSAVGIGVTAAPRHTPDVPAQIASKSGQAAAFAVARADAGASSSPTPAPTPSLDREPTAVAAAAIEAPALTTEGAPDPLVVEPARTLVPQAEPVLEPARVARTSTRGHGRHHGARSSRATSTHAAKVTRTALVVPASVDKPADQPSAAAPVEQPLAAPAEPSAAPQVEAPNELALIRKAMTSLRDRDPVRALALLEDHAARFPSGSFATERRGLRVVALCASGKLAEGRREQVAFLKSYASSPIAARVRGACAEHDD